VPARLRPIATHIGLFAAYVLAAKVGLVFADVNPSATAVWPPTGIAIAAIVILGPGYWPSIFAGAFVANMMAAGTAVTSLGIATGNTLEALAAAVLIGRRTGRAAMFNRASGVLRFVLAAAVATPIGATIGVVTLGLGGYAAWATAAPVWLTWWLGDFGGALLVAPLILLWSEKQPGVWSAERELELVLLLGSLLATTYAVFYGPLAGMAGRPVEFLTVPFLIWAAFRFGPRETVTAAALLSFVATWGALQHGGHLLLVQAFAGVTSVTVLLVAALVVDRKGLLSAEQAARLQAEDAVRAKEHFIAMLSHELRNRISTIATSVDVQHRQSGLRDKDVARDIIARQVTQLTQMVDDVMDVLRMPSSPPPIDRSPVDLRAVITRAIESLESPGRPSSHWIEATGEPVWVSGDSKRLIQVVTNLLTNSMKFTPPGGLISASVTRDGGDAQIVVTDTGIGIEADLLARIFDLFSQAGADETRRHHGLGLGLTLVRALVTLHGGTVEASSNGRNHGSTFTVRIPAIDTPAIVHEARASAKPETPIITPRRRVLVVEDDPDLREILSVALQASGHEVIVADNGPSAVDAIERFRPSVAIVDIGLPVFDGYEVARRARRSPHGRETFLVALTGHGDLASGERAEEAGFNIHLVKPVEARQLSDIIISSRVH
jgi:signal transduction histidine kinase/ActR/RegA family two-component response regulator